MDDKKMTWAIIFLIVWGFIGPVLGFITGALAVRYSDAVTKISSH